MRNRVSKAIVVSSHFLALLRRGSFSSFFLVPDYPFPVGERPSPFLFSLGPLVWFFTRARTVVSACIIFWIAFAFVDCDRQACFFLLASLSFFFLVAEMS